MKELINIIKEHLIYKKQLFKLAKADLMKTYRGSALGWAWAIIKPSVTIFVYWFAFAIGLRVRGDVNGYPFFLWLIAGIVPWFYISDMLRSGTESVRRYSYLVTKMKFPVSTIPTFVSMSKISVHFLLQVIVILIFTFKGYPPDIYLLQIPFYMVCMFIFFTTWALFGSMLASISKDFSNLVKSMITAVFWLSGIMWNSDTIKIHWLKIFLKINPVTFIVDGYRNVYINKIWFYEEPLELICFIVVQIIMLILAVWSYKRLRKDIPDVL